MHKGILSWEKCLPPSAAPDPEVSGAFCGLTLARARGCLSVHDRWEGKLTLSAVTANGFTTNPAAARRWQRPRRQWERLAAQPGRCMTSAELKHSATELCITSGRKILAQSIRTELINVWIGLRGLFCHVEFITMSQKLLFILRLTTRETTHKDRIQLLQSNHENQRLEDSAH